MNSTAEKLKSYAARVERIEDEIKAMNSDKSELFKEMKQFGLDVKAFKSAYRRHLALRDNAIATEMLDETVETYLAAIQGAALQKTPVAPVSAPANGISEAPYAHARMKQPAPEVGAVVNEGLVLLDAGNGRVGLSEAGEIPHFLRMALP